MKHKCSYEMSHETIVLSNNIWEQEAAYILVHCLWYYWRIAISGSGEKDTTFYIWPSILPLSSKSTWRKEGFFLFIFWMCLHKFLFFIWWVVGVVGLLYDYSPVQHFSNYGVEDWLRLWRLCPLWVVSAINIFVNFFFL